MIRGSGGGGKGGGSSGHTPVEAPDSLRSRAYARVIDLVCEGEVEGLVDGLKSIYLNETPLQNSDGTNNFSGITFDTRTGTQSQSYISGFPSVENEVTVGLQVKNTLPIVRTVTSDEIDAVRIRVSIPQLSDTSTSTGDISGASVSLSIDIQSNGGGYVEKITDTISGKTTSKYERCYYVKFSGQAPFDVRVRRITADSDRATLVNSTFFESYTEIIESKLRYPNSALVAVQVDASQFQGIPTRAYDMKLLKVRVPVNYDSESREYVGIWDGSFKISWTDNPAWILYDLLTEDRYGLGGFIPGQQVDKWGLYTISKYCDELVQDGFGGMEPRFTCNVYLQSQEEAFKVIQDLASVFRGMVFWESGAITLTQDAPSDPVALYTAANVVAGNFNYSGSSRRARHTVALVSWNDPSDFYRQKVEYVEETAGIARYGVIQTDVTAFGCTSRGQANRVGKWLLYAEQNESETVTFKVGLDGVLVRPGQIVKVSDPMRAGKRFGGRIASATQNSITIDSDLSHDLSGFTLSVMLPDGSMDTRYFHRQDARVISVTEDFSDTPQVGAIWVLSSTEVEAQLFRVITAVESEDSTITITGLAHNPSKYGAIEEGLTLQQRDITLLSSTPSAPTGLSIKESLYQYKNEYRNLIQVSWEQALGAVESLVTYSVNGGNLITLQRTQSQYVEIENAELGDYTFSVRAVGVTGKFSPATTKTYTVLGKLSPPSDVEWFLIDSDVLTWGGVTDIDLVGYDIRYQIGVSRSWGDALPLVTGFVTSSPYKISTRPEGLVTLLIKAVDSSGVESLNPAFITVDLGDQIVGNVVDLFDFHALEFPIGEIVNGSIETATGDLIADSDTTPLMWFSDGRDQWDLDDSVLMWESTYKQMIYISSPYPVDQGDVWASATIPYEVESGSFTIEYRKSGESPEWSSDIDLMWGGLDTDPLWLFSDWLPFLGSITLENTTYEIKITTSASTIQGRISGLALQVDVPDIIERFNDVVISSGGTRLPIKNTYRYISNVSITLQDDGGSARTVRVMDKNETLGALIKCFDINGNATSGKIDSIIQGY